MLSDVNDAMLGDVRKLFFHIRVFLRISTSSGALTPSTPCHMLRVRVPLPLPRSAFTIVRLRLRSRSPLRTGPASGRLQRLVRLRAA